MTTDHSLILIAQIVGVHGIKGWVKIKPLGEDYRDLLTYDPLVDAKQTRTFKIKQIHPHGKTFIAQLDGIHDRTAAEKIKRPFDLYIHRDQLPDIDDDNTFYHADLIGMVVKTDTGNILGTCHSIANFGASDLIEVKPPKGHTFYIPFTDDIVPDIDIEKGEITVIPPLGLLDE